MQKQSKHISFSLPLSEQLPLGQNWIEESPMGTFEYDYRINNKTNFAGSM